MFDASDDYLKTNGVFLQNSVAAPEIFCGGGIEGAKCDSEGAKIQKFAENG